MAVIKVKASAYMPETADLREKENFRNACHMPQAPQSKEELPMRNNEMFGCPEKYQNQLFLTPADLKEIMGIGDSLVYAFLRNAPFRKEKIGGKILVFANSFWDWYNGMAS